MTYTIRTTGTESGKGWRHEFLRDGKLTSYAEYSPKQNPPARMRRWLNKLNGASDGKIGLRTPGAGRNVDPQPVSTRR